MLNDGTKSFDHAKDGFDTKLGGCTSFFRNLDYPASFSLVYQKGKFTFSTSTTETKNFVECFSSSNIKLPDSFYIGFSAATGGVSDTHDIFRVYTMSLDDPESNKGEPLMRKAEERYSEEFSKPIESSSGLFSFLKNLLIMVMVLFVLYVIWVYYQSTKTQSYKRF
jgi:hypothetical protein